MDGVADILREAGPATERAGQQVMIASTSTRQISTLPAVDMVDVGSRRLGRVLIVYGVIPVLKTDNAPFE